MTFIEKFFGREPHKITADDIKNFILEKNEESTILDYKNIALYKNPDSLSEHVSAMANSEGGLIILGISEKQDKDEGGHILRIYPGKITWGKPSMRKETLDHKLSNSIAPIIDNLIITHQK